MSNQPPFEEVVPTTGFLTDKRILAALAAGYLIEPGTWNEAQLRHASYTIRLGQRVELERHPAGSGQREQQSKMLTNGGPPLELRPGEKALLYSLENLRLPNCVLGFTVARGLLVYESLVPENTYIDPGFTGQIYTTVTNLSGRVLKLPYGMPIARLFFYKLAENVDRPYQTGPAIGIDQHLESSAGIAFPTTAEAGAASATALLDDLVATERGGARTAELIKRNAALLRSAILTAICWPVVLQSVLGWHWLRDNTNVIVTGAVGSLLAAAIVAAGTRIWARIGR
jgi:deoxycytidine triphosphate deaminase